MELYSSDPHSRKDQLPGFEGCGQLMPLADILFRVGCRFKIRTHYSLGIESLCLSKGTDCGNR